MFPETVKTARLLLRKPNQVDAEAIFGAYAQDREVTRYLAWRPHTSIDTTKEFIAACEGGWRDAKAFPYVMTRESDGELLGMIEFRSQDHRMDFGYVLARPHWGQGLMTEAVSRLVRIALEQPTVYRVWATCDVDNTASARVMEKAGLVREGLLRKYMVHPNVSPEPRDSWIYAITR